MEEGHEDRLFEPEGALKRCSLCRVTKPLTEFNVRRKSRDGVQSMCRQCSAERSRRYHQENKRRHINQINKRKALFVARNRQFLLEYLLQHPCADCGESDPLVLEFDHLRDKAGNVSYLLLVSSWERISNEIAKCDVVCANCHRRRTQARQGSYRLKWGRAE